MSFYTFASLLILVAACSATPEWTNLRVTYKFNASDPWGFNVMPRDLKGPLGGFHLRDNQCEVENRKFLGQRYWYYQDPQITLLYDTNGIIAGMQTSVAKANFTPSAFLKNKQFLDDGDYWTLTVYFVDPSLICGAGRSSQQLQTEGTGTGLWIQNGPDPIQDSVLIPFLESDVKSTKWIFGKCFKTQGNHYWFNITKDMDCGRFPTNCLMYNGGKLNAFCFSVSDNLPSPRFEHPTADHAKAFIDPVPDCIWEKGWQLSTIHVYFIDDPMKQAMC